MKSTRERILTALLGHPQATISDLAEAVGINAISVRHHLTSLQAEAMVNAEEERHGVGRPRLVYSLTETGIEHFPTHYFRFTNRLLEQLKETMSESELRELFTQMANNLAVEYARKGKNLSPKKKLDLLKDMLAEEGFIIDWEKQDDGYLIREVSCPYFHISQNHPEVCSMDQALISAILAVPSEKIGCVVDGDSHCVFKVSSLATPEKV
jgi:DeoR family transcriptional regulator, suf operon transcriptional repressor